MCLLYVFCVHFSATAKVSAKNCNTIVSQNTDIFEHYSVTFRVNALLCSYAWCDLLTFMPIMSVPKSSED